MSNTRQVRSRQVNELPVVAVTDAAEPVGCSTGTTVTRCRIVPTFSLANGNVPVSAGLEALPAPSPCTAAELTDDDEQASILGGTEVSAERFSTLNECVCFGGTGGGTVDVDP